MPVHRLRFYLRLILVCLVLAIVEVLVWGAFTPAPAIVVNPQNKESAATTDGSESPTLPPLRDFAQFFARPLRQPLYTDPAAMRVTAPSAARVVARQGMTFKLFGTIMDGEQSTAIVVDRLGKQSLKQVGDHLGVEGAGPLVVNIAEKQIVIDEFGRRVTLPLVDPLALENAENAAVKSGPGSSP